MTKNQLISRIKNLIHQSDERYFEIGKLLYEARLTPMFHSETEYHFFLRENFGFSYRKADYLVAIYVKLTDLKIDFSKFKGIGWTKLSIIGPSLTSKNVDIWIQRARIFNADDLRSIVSTGQPRTEKHAARVSEAAMVKELRRRGVKAAVKILQQAFPEQEMIYSE